MLRRAECLTGGGGVPTERVRLLLVAVTAMSDEVSRQRTIAGGFNLHLVKPVDPEKLVAVVDALFRQAEAMGRPEALAAIQYLQWPPE